MITDSQTNTVYFSDLLKLQFPKIENALTNLLLKDGITIKEIHGTKDIWCRDYMPIQIGSEKFILFVYDPPYLRNRKDLRTDPVELPYDVKSSHLILDGGNVVKAKNKAIITSNVYIDNAIFSRHEIDHMLMTTLEVDEVIIIPRQPYDWTGHSDGMIRFLDENTVLVNNFEKDSASFKKELYQKLQRHKLEVVLFPYSYPTSGNNLTAEGCYINYLHVGNTIVLPTYNHAFDEQAFNDLSGIYPHHRIHTLPSIELAKEGGVLNCVSWNVRL